MLDFGQGEAAALEVQDQTYLNNGLQPIEL